MTDIKPNVFLDCGSNHGQGFEHFRKIYHTGFHYMLFDANRFCCEFLHNKYKDDPTIVIYNNAIYSQAGKKTFTFRSEDDVGGSLVDVHNSAYKDYFYLSSIDKLESCKQTVNCIDINALINNLLSKIYNNIIIKMDIESAEYDVLESMIEHGTIKKVKKMYIEFHTKFMLSKDREQYIQREYNIIDWMHLNNIDWEFWG